MNRLTGQGEFQYAHTHFASLCLCYYRTRSMVRYPCHFLYFFSGVSLYIETICYIMISFAHVRVLNLLLQRAFIEQPINHRMEQYLVIGSSFQTWHGISDVELLPRSFPAKCYGNNTSVSSHCLLFCTHIIIVPEANILGRLSSPDQKP